MRLTFLLTVGLATHVRAFFPGAAALCESVFDEDDCEIVAQFDILDEDFIFGDLFGDADNLFDPLGLFTDDDAKSPPPPSPSPPPPA